MNDPEYFEKERFIDSINEEFQKLHEKTPASDRLTRVKILDGMEQSKRDFKNSCRIRDV
jgi:hypothetical protein